MNVAPANWWETKWFILFASLLCAVPLLWPTVPPLTDVPGHIGRYAIQLDQAGAAAHDWYDFKWQLIGNLGVDLLIEPLGRVFGVELGTKIIVIAIPVLMAAGLLLVAREVHGRVPPNALWALPLVYSYPMIFGFANFMLSVALALLAFALWLRLARAGKFRLRLFLFIPIACLLWVCHTYGVGIFGILAFCSEAERHRLAGRSWLSTTLRAVLGCAPLLFPLILIFATRSQSGGLGTELWFFWPWKMSHLIGVLRDRWMPLDVATLIAMALLLYRLCRQKDFGWSPMLTVSAAVCTLLFLLMPDTIFGSHLADMRMVPLALAIVLIAAAPRSTANARALSFIAVAGLALFGVRIAGHSVSFAMDSRRMEQATQALEHVPRGSRLFSLVGQVCKAPWRRPPLDHLPGLALARRHAFSNEQWATTGAQMLSVDFLPGSQWDEDYSQFIFPLGCSEGLQSQQSALKNFPRDAYDLVWMIAPPEPAKIDASGLTLIWSNGPDRLYQIIHSVQKKIPKAEPSS